MKKALNLIGKLLTLLAFVFIGIKLAKADIDLSSVNSVGKLIMFSLIGVVICTVTVFLLGIAWGRFVSVLGATAQSKKVIYDAAIVYSKANIAKYIPGNVFQYVERNVFLNNSGLDQAGIAAATVSEIAGLVFTGIILCITLSYSKIRRVCSELITLPMMLTAIAIIIIAIAAVTIICLKSKKIREVLGRIMSRNFLKTFLLNILIYALVLIMLGSTLLLTAQGMNLALNISGFELIAVYIISWLAGFIIIGAPGGIGIRELVISLLIADTALSGPILVAAVIQRIVTIIGDVAAYLISCFKRKKR